MMKNLLILLCISAFTPIFSQTPFKRYSIQVETGFFDRGLIGLSYQKYLSHSEKTLSSIGLGTGLGADIDFGAWGFPDLDANANFFLNYAYSNKIVQAEKPLWFTVGVQPKVVLRKYNTLFFERSTASTALYAGLTCFLSKGSFIQFRLGAAPHFKLSNFDFDTIVPTFGIALGKPF